MYRLPENIDLSFLLQKELEQICFGLHQVIFNFNGNISISVESKMRCVTETSQVLIDRYSAEASLLCSLLGYSIIQTKGQEDGTLSLIFSNNIILNIYDDNLSYESYIIRNESKTIIV